MNLGARRGDLAAAGLLCAAAAFIVQQSAGWPVAADVAGNPVVFPRILAAIMALAAAALVFGRRNPPEKSAEESAEQRQPHRAWLAIGATIAVAAALEKLGVIPAAALYILFLQRLSGAPWRSSIAYAAITPIVIWLIFATALKVPLPWGDLLPASWRV